MIDTTYFVRDINVPLSSNTLLNTEFTNSITRYEPEILKSLLGYTLWKEFTDAITAAAEEGAPALAQKWVDLRDGKAFSFDLNGETVNTYWNGLINSEKTSLIAYYVYYKHRTAHETSYTGLGQMMAKGENSKPVSPVHKLVWAYNQMIDMYGAIPSRARRYSFLDNSDYVHYNAEPSAYNFLLANKATYSNWVFKPLAKINSFGI